ncbi:MAG: hypothetical protein LRY66_08245 [Saccharospirillaceae bacterium]|nr:hypothetical protein [Saccharospirillaceae bacterium]MCD8531341.1 hypothetical protein [Saccharospirillaceae bacterium]
MSTPTDTAWLPYIISIALVAAIGMLISGLKNKRIFAFGRWYKAGENTSLYVQVVIGYLLLIALFIFLLLQLLLRRL